MIKGRKTRQSKAGSGSDSVLDSGVSAPTYPFAACYDEEAETNIAVYIPEQYPEGIPQVLLDHGEVYDPAKHDGYLLCPDGCAVHIHYNSGYATDKKTVLPHFKSDPESVHHKDCKYKPPQDLVGVLHIEDFRTDPTERDFHHRSGTYVADNMRHPATAAGYESLKGRARLHFSKAADYVKLIKKGQFDQIKNMILLDQHQQIDEKDFFVRYTRNTGKMEKRFINLFNRLQRLPEGSSLPCLMEFQISAGIKDRRGNAHHSVTSRQMYHYQESGDNGYDGAKHFLAPRAMPFPANTGLAEECFPKAGNYVVLGYVSLGREIARDATVIHYMDIDIHHPDQVAKVDIDQIIADRKASKGKSHHPSAAPT